MEINKNELGDWVITEGKSKAIVPGDVRVVQSTPNAFVAFSGYTVYVVVVLMGEGIQGCLVCMVDTHVESDSPVTEVKVLNENLLVVVIDGKERVLPSPLAIVQGLRNLKEEETETGVCITQSVELS